MVNREYIPFSDGWYKNWTSTCHLTGRSLSLPEGALVQPNFKDPHLFANAPRGRIDAIYYEGDDPYATVVWTTTTGSDEIPLLALIPARR